MYFNALGEKVSRACYCEMQQAAKSRRWHVGAEGRFKPPGAISNPRSQSGCQSGYKPVCAASLRVSLRKADQDLKG